MRLLLFLRSISKRTRPCLHPLISTRAPPLAYLPSRSIHDLTHSPLPQPQFQSRILESDPNTKPDPTPEEQSDEGMTEFLSRFVHVFRPTLADAFPGVARHVLDEMLLIICQKVVSKLDAADTAVATGIDSVPDIELSEDLWKAVWEASTAVNEAMRRDRVRAELKKYLHCEEVKEMCRFAADVGIRGTMLRELRFKWAREKLEEVEFYRGLDEMYKAGTRQEEEVTGVVEERPKLMALPERKGSIKYKIYGLDLSGPEWAEVAERTREAESHFVPEEPKRVEGKCKIVEERLMWLNAKKDDLVLVLAEWKEEQVPKRVDWLALLERIKERNATLYLKVISLGTYAC